VEYERLTTEIDSAISSLNMAKTESNGPRRIGLRGYLHTVDENLHINVSVSASFSFFHREGKTHLALHKLPVKIPENATAQDGSEPEKTEKRRKYEVAIPNINLRRGKP
jgi:hypothetical protein